MRERFRRRPSWIGTLVKIIIVLVFPISFYVDIFFNNNIVWESILFSIASSGTIVFDSILVLSAIFVMLPGIYFDLKINSSPISNPIRKKAAIVTIVSWLLTFDPLYIRILNPDWVDLGPYSAITFIPTLTIPLFIVLPILNRELVVRSTPANLRKHSLSYLYNGFKNRFGRRRFLPFLIWGGFFFSPIIILGFWGNVELLSMFYRTTIGLDYYYFDFPYFYGIYLNLVPMIVLPSFLLLFSIRLVFIRDIYRFSDGRVTKSRLISIGLLAEIVPVAVLTLMYTTISIGMDVFPGSFTQFIFPTPIFPLLGYLYVRFSKLRITPDEPWDEEEHRMWFEEEQPTPTPGPQPIEHRIKVPISYLIVSQFRKLRKK